MHMYLYRYIAQNSRLHHMPFNNSKLLYSIAFPNNKKGCNTCVCCFKQVHLVCRSERGFKQKKREKTNSTCISSLFQWKCKCNKTIREIVNARERTNIFPRTFLHKFHGLFFGYTWTTILVLFLMLCPPRIWKSIILFQQSFAPIRLWFEILFSNLCLFIRTKSIHHLK